MKEIIRIKKIIVLILPSVKDPEFKNKLVNMWEWKTGTGRFNASERYINRFGITKTFGSKVEASVWPEEAKELMKAIAMDGSTTTVWRNIEWWIEHQGDFDHLYYPDGWGYDGRTTTDDDDE